jgi:hypothetical protein
MWRGAPKIVLLAAKLEDFDGIFHVGWVFLWLLSKPRAPKNGDDLDDLGMVYGIGLTTLMNFMGFRWI